MPTKREQYLRGQVDLLLEYLEFYANHWGYSVDSPIFERPERRPWRLSVIGRHDGPGPRQYIVERDGVPGDPYPQCSYRLRTDCSGWIEDETVSEDDLYDETTFKSVEAAIRAIFQMHDYHQCRRCGHFQYRDSMLDDWCISCWRDVRSDHEKGQK